MSREHAVVIVGGGPAGLSTWLHLHDLDPRLAARCVVVDKAVHPREKICGGGVTWPGDRQLEILDAAVDVPAVPIHRIEFRFGPESLSLAGDDALRVVRRAEFDHALAQRAVARGLEIHEGVALQALRVAEGHVDLRTDRGDYRARVVVGADGAQSTVRGQAGLTAGAMLSRLIKVVTGDAEALDPPHRDTVVFDFSAAGRGLQGYVWHFPCVEAGRPRMDRGVFDSRVCRDRARADLPAILGSALDAAGVEHRPGAWRAHPVRPYTPEGALAAPHVVLAGDAAGIDPVLGEGISQSLQHGDVVADALVDAFTRDDFSLASYGERFADHALGRSLRHRFDLARELFGGEAPGLDAMRTRFGRWLAAGLP
jgi:flavin-dependent dehydrogenase